MDTVTPLEAPIEVVGSRPIRTVQGVQGVQGVPDAQAEQPAEFSAGSAASANPTGSTSSTGSTGSTGSSFAASLMPRKETMWKALFLLFLAAAGYLVWCKWTKVREERELERQMGANNGLQGGPPDIADGFPQPPNDGRQYEWIEGQGWVPVGLQIADPSHLAAGVPYGDNPGHSNAQRLSQAALGHKQQPSLTDPRDPNGAARQAQEQAQIAMSQAGLGGGPPQQAGFQLKPASSKTAPPFLTGLNRG